MEQLIAADLRGREDDTTVQKTVDGRQQVLPVVSLVCCLMEVLKERTEAGSMMQCFLHFMGLRH